MNYKTINETAKSVGIPHSILRDWQKAGKLPGFYRNGKAGGTFYVNQDQLIRMLENAPIPASVPDAAAGQ